MVALHVDPQLLWQLAFAELDNRQRNTRRLAAVITDADIQACTQLDGSLELVLRLFGLLLCCFRAREADVSAFKGAHVLVRGVTDVLSIATTDLGEIQS